MNDSRDVIKTARSLLTRHEGLRRKPYTCTAGKLTIGIGRNIEDRGLSDDEIKLLFMNDVLIATRDCESMFARFGRITPAARQAALIDMAFNLGRARLAMFTNMRAAVDRNDWETAAAEAENSKWYHDVGGKPGQRGWRIVHILRHGILPKE